MEEHLFKSLESVPGILAMVILVTVFLKFLHGLLASHAKRTDEFIKTVENMNIETTRVVRDMNGVISNLVVKTNDLTERNVIALTHNTVATQEMTKAFNTLSDGVRQQTSAHRKIS